MIKEKLHLHKTLEVAYLALTLATLNLAAICTILMNIGLDHIRIISITGTFFLTALWFFFSTREPEIPSEENLNNIYLHILGYIVVFATGLIILYIYWNGGTLPADDPVAIPTFSQAIDLNKTLVDYYAKGTSGHSYPPGAPILYSYILGWLTPINALLAFKIINIASLWLIPLTWAWVWAKYLPLNISMGAWVAICYFMFWGLDQTIGFTLPFAGKNALVIGLFITPAVVDIIIKSCKRNLLWLITPLAFFGLILINYSLLHVITVLTFVFLINDIANLRKNIRFYLKLSYVFTITGLLVYFILNEAISDPRAGGVDFYPIQGLLAAFENYVSKSSTVIIYNDAEFGISHSYYRGLFFLFFWIAALFTSFSIKSSLLKNALIASLLAVILIISFGFKVLPAAMTLDYARWILWPIQAMAYSIVFGVIINFFSYAQSQHVKFCLAVFFILSISILTQNIYKNTRVFKTTVDSQAITREELGSLRAELEIFATKNKCILLTKSTLSSDKLSASQNDVRYKYAEVVSPCKFGNGSWVNAGSADLRELGGFPNLNKLQELIKSANVIIIDNNENINNYLELLNINNEKIKASVLEKNGSKSTILLENSGI
ncbi:hypothetical protein [Pseudomonas fluorescens]|uniref:Glycosyltransferase RgtA/B/C/D-like domain-containing protein n=1 Tax=Pseudomonas fluorescens TaxID=294 RepID=A0A5E7BTR8_PSEFL|nr:hypothetical protein [Pseudomonas fluorescens]VVN93147.1 hypothetical protein PS710_02048 [Pseudomonas fluorescens]